MTISKRKKIICSSILGLTAISTITSSIYVINGDKYTQSSKSLSSSSISSRNTSSISYKLGDIIDSYQSGFNVYTVNEIVVAPASATNLSAPDLSKNLIRITISNNVINITNSYGSNRNVWDERIDYNNNMYTSPTSFTTPDTAAIEKNLFKLSEYNKSTDLSGTNNILWDSRNNIPSVITGSRTVTDSNAFLLQMSIENINTVSSGHRAQIFINKGTLDNPNWAIPNATYGWSSLGTQFSIEGFFVKDIETSNIKYYAPNNTTPSIGSWKINSNATANTYLNMPIQMAFEQLQQRPADISEIIDWRPSMLLPSMSEFPITLVLNNQENRWEFDYGNNSTFKYIFNAVKKGSARHIFPFYFDTSDLSQPTVPGTYINIKEDFENYNLDRSIVDGFTKGTYIIPSTWTIDKNRYPSQVSDDEIKTLALSHIGNAPSNLTTNDIIIVKGDNFITNNVTGQVSFNIILKKYINDQGEVVNDELGKIFEPRQTISGFKTISPTKFNTNFEVFDVQNSNLIATEQTPDDIKNIIITNKSLFFNSLASDIGGEPLTTNDISVQIVSSTNNTTSQYSSGHLVANVSINSNFLTEPYALIAKAGDAPLTFTITIKGYKVLKSTTIYESVNIVQQNLLASDQTEQDIRTLIVNNSDLFIKNYPPELDLSNPNDFRINHIVTKNNLGDKSIYDGQYGYIVLNVTIAKIYNDTGTIETNKTYNLTISGYKKITPTKITTSVNMPSMANSLATDIIRSADDAKLLITRNQNLFFNNTSLTNDYASHLLVTNYKCTNINDVYQLRIDVQLNKYYDSSGILITPENNKPLIATIYISGFKVITPTTINAGSYVVASKYQSNYASFISIDTLSEIILATQGGIENGSIISGSRPVGFSQNNLIISNVVANNISGTIEFRLNLNYRYENNDEGNITNEPFPTDFFIILRGFKVAEPTRPTLNNPLIITNAYPLLTQLNAIQMKNIIIKEVNGDLLNDNEREILNQLKLFVWTEGYMGYKEPFSPDQITFSRISKWDSLDGHIQVTFSINRYMDSTGEVVNGEIVSIKDIIGFSKIVPTSINKQEFPFIATSHLYASVTPQYIIDNGLLPDVIKNHDAQYSSSSGLKIILGDLPPDFDYNKNLVITNIKVDDTYATISFDLSVNYYYNNVNGEIVTPDTGFALPPVNVTIRGFKTIPSTTINGIILSDEYFYPTDKNLTGKVLNVNIQKKSNLKYKTSQGFVDSINKFSSNPTEVVAEYLKSIFYYSDDLYSTINTNSPLIVYNPQSNKTLAFDAIIVNNIDNVYGSILITARARGFYYSHSNEATQIINTDGGNYAYIDILISGFLLEVYQDFNVQNLFIIFAVTIPGTIILIFFLILLINSLRKRKNKLTSADDDMEDLLIRD